MTSSVDHDRAVFNSAIQALEAEVANVGAHLALDASVRQAYDRQIKAMADGLRAQAHRGQMTWPQAAAHVNEARNTIMLIARGRSTPVGRAMAEHLKKEGRTLDQLVNHKARQLYGPGSRFAQLS